MRYIKVSWSFCLTLPLHLQFKQQNSMRDCCLWLRIPLVDGFCGSRPEYFFTVSLRDIVLLPQPWLAYAKVDITQFFCCCLPRFWISRSKAWRRNRKVDCGQKVSWFGRLCGCDVIVDIWSWRRIRRGRRCIFGWTTSFRSWSFNGVFSHVSWLTVCPSSQFTTYLSFRGKSHFYF